MPMFHRCARLLFALLALHGLSRADIVRDIPFARAGDAELKLDLYRPDQQTLRPLVVWVHGGAWRSGSKNDMPLSALVAAGFPVASVDYRLSPVARFPAQIHDLKAAIRFLRAKQKELKTDARTIVIAGSSAGGHLAALVGVTNGDKELEGAMGDFPEQSSAVQGIVSFFGAANLATILAQSTPHGLSVRKPALDLLLGGQPDAVPDLARLASPVFHADKSDPPLLLFHGDQDPQMPVNQALELAGAYEAAGCTVQLQIVHGAGHGGVAFFDEKRLNQVKQFLARIRN